MPRAHESLGGGCQVSVANRRNGRGKPPRNDVAYVLHDNVCGVHTGHSKRNDTGVVTAEVPQRQYEGQWNADRYRTTAVAEYVERVAYQLNAPSVSAIFPAFREHKIYRLVVYFADAEDAVHGGGILSS